MYYAACVSREDAKFLAKIFIKCSQYTQCVSNTSHKMGVSELNHHIVLRINTCINTKTAHLFQDLLVLCITLRYRICVEIEPS
jgi:hypothetical protein